jgi:hypothetical protein
MIRFKVLAIAVALGMGLAAGPALAKNACSPFKNKKKGCKNEIRSCTKVYACKTVKGKARRKCVKNCKTATVNSCKLDNAVCTASPSGAFLD